MVMASWSPGFTKVLQGYSFGRKGKGRERYWYVQGRPGGQGTGGRALGDDECALAASRGCLLGETGVGRD
jgi:hypothetical protein